MFYVYSTPIFTSVRPQAKAHQFVRTLQHVSKRQKTSVTTPKKPVDHAGTLEKNMKGIKKGKRKGIKVPKYDKSRLNIVSESLCGEFYRIYFHVHMANHRQTIS
jgi:hypothetical protein